MSQLYVVILFVFGVATSAALFVFLLALTVLGVNGITASEIVTALLLGVITWFLLTIVSISRIGH